MVTKSGAMKYSGRLRPDEIANGMNAAARNAARLLDDAKLLFEAGRFPSATFLAILSIEESGKVSALRNIATARDGDELKNAWKDFRSHRAKNRLWTIIDHARTGARTIWDLSPMFDPESDHPDILEEIKQGCVYADYHGDNRWTQTEAAIGKDLAKSLLVAANVLCGKAEHTPREIELWIEHVGPSRGRPEMVLGAQRYFEAMKREGLHTKDTKEMARFLGLKRGASTSKRN